MRSFSKLLITEAKLFLREPTAFFFTLAFPLIMLFVFGGIYGNEPNEFYGGYGAVDASVPAYIAMIIANVALMGIPVRLATLREQGVLRRLRATPVRPKTILVSQITVNFAMTLFGSFLLIIAGGMFYDLQFGGGALKALNVFGGLCFERGQFYERRLYDCQRGPHRPLCPNHRDGAVLPHAFSLRGDGSSERDVGGHCAPLKNAAFDPCGGFTARFVA